MLATRSWVMLVLACADPVTKDVEMLASRERAKEALAGQRIRVTFGACSDPYLFKGGSGSVEGYSGVVVDLLKELQQEANFSVQVLDVSRESLEEVGADRDTACARDISLNRTDLCVGNVWVTPQRLGYARVLPTLWEERFRLGVPVTQAHGFGAQVRTLFLPFHARLWASTFVFLFVFALSFCIIERRTNHVAFPDKDRSLALAQSIAHVGNGFFWGDPPFRPITGEGKLLMGALGLLILVLLSSYTASLAAVMVARSNLSTIKDLEMAIVQRKRVCMWVYVLDNARRLPMSRGLYPNLVELSVHISSNEEGYDFMSSGQCDAILVDEVFHKKMQERSERNCDKVLVGNPVLHLNCAWPSADWLVSPLAYFITDMTTRGLLETVRKRHEGVGDCAAFTAAFSELVSLGIGDVAGIFVIMACFTLVAIIVHIFKYCCRGLWDALSRDSSRSRSRASSRYQSTYGDRYSSVGPAQSATRRDEGSRQLHDRPFARTLLALGRVQAEAQWRLLAEADWTLGLTGAADEILQRTHDNMRVVVSDNLRAVASIASDARDASSDKMWPVAVGSLSDTEEDQEEGLYAL